jgi:hypothetical protein
MTAHIRFLWYSPAMLRRLVVASLLAAGPASVHAQARVESGSRVRVTAPALADTAVTGRVITVESASLLLAVKDDSAATQVPFSAIRSLEVARDRGARRQSVTTWTSVAGAVAGYILAFPPGSGSCTDGCGIARLMGLVVGAAAGGLAGLLFTAGEPDVWIPARVPEPR